MSRHTTHRTASRVVALRLDSAGDVLLAGPAVRALAHSSDHLTLVTGPLGSEVARLLPGVDEVITWQAPWIAAGSPPVDRHDVEGFVERMAAVSADLAVIFTSFHQSALPTALLLRLAGVPRIVATSEDYPGGLLDVRHVRPPGLHEVEAMLALAEAAGAALPAGDDGLLRLQDDLPDPPVDGPYVALHPGASVAARAWPVQRWQELARLLASQGRRFVVTGGPRERSLTRSTVRAGGGRAGLDLGGRTTWASLASVFAGAEAVVAANTGPAHLAAAVGAPLVSLFAPTVPASRWAPYRVPAVMLGDQSAACRDSRATTCPIVGHPCLAGVEAVEVLAALDEIAGRAS